MHAHRPAGAAFPAHIEAAIAAEQLGGQQVIILCLVTGGSLLVLLHLLLHTVKQVLRDNSGDAIRDHHIPVTQFAHVPPVL